MRVWKAGVAGAVMLGTAAVTLSGAEAPGQVIIDRQEVVPSVREPLEMARQMVRVLGGSRLGVSIEDVDAADVTAKKLPSQSGALVQSVEDGSAAAKAGIKAGDVIVEFDGERVRSAAQLRRLIQETPAGRKVSIAVSRDGQRMPLSVEPQDEGGAAFSRVLPRLEATVRPPRAPRAPRPPEPPRVFRTPTPDMRIPQMELFRDGYTYSFNGGRLGVSTQTVSEQLAKHFGVERGVLVTDVRADSAASKAGLRAGDVITKVGSTAIDDTGDLMRAIGEAKGEVSIEIVRDRKAQTLKATVEDVPTRVIRRVI